MSLNHLRSYGWMRTTVKPGDVISATGGAARSGAPSMISAVIELPDGERSAHDSQSVHPRRVASLALSAAQQARLRPRSRARALAVSGSRPAARTHHGVQGGTASIKPGESTTLTWAVENPRTTTIEPTVGRATPRGVLKVTPKATTTYVDRDWRERHADQNGDRQRGRHNAGRRNDVSAAEPAARAAHG